MAAWRTAAFWGKSDFSLAVRQRSMLQDRQPVLSAGLYRSWPGGGHHPLVVFQSLSAGSKWSNKRSGGDVSRILSGKFDKLLLLFLILVLAATMVQRQKFLDDFDVVCI